MPNMENNSCESKSGNYHLIKTDAEALLRLVNKYVKVQLIKNTEMLGFVHSFDPVDHSIILIIQNEDSYKINFIPGHAILDVTEIHPAPNNNPIKQKTTVQTTSNDVAMKKQKLISWFKRNLLPVTESGEKILFGNVIVLPPYGIDNICTDNPVVAMQLRKIIENMPDNLDPGI